MSGVFGKILTTAWNGGIGFTAHRMMQAIPNPIARISFQVINAAFTAYGIYDTWSSNKDGKKVVEDTTTVDGEE